MLTGIIVGVHILVSLLLVLFILLKSGRGGGLSDMFGGGSMSTMSGSTVVERNLDDVEAAARVGLVRIGRRAAAEEHRGYTAALHERQLAAQIAQQRVDILRAFGEACREDLQRVPLPQGRHPNWAPRGFTARSATAL